MPMNNLYISILIGLFVFLGKVFISTDFYRMNPRLVSINELSPGRIVPALFIGTLIGFIFYKRLNK
jgi:hypothetical protein